jgi:glutamyl/glutaminyl-tRNA synthetase
MTRVRFAPSPTGYLHIGGARTFIFNWLHARHQGGVVVLRIDDTDVERNTQASLDSIREGLEWLELGWDEIKTLLDNAISIVGPPGLFSKRGLRIATSRPPPRRSRIQARIAF